MTDKRQHDDQAVEELDVRPVRPAEMMPVWMKEMISAPIAPPATVPMPPQAGVPPTKTEASAGGKIAVAGGRPPSEVDHNREAAGERRAEAHIHEGGDPDAADVDAHLGGAVGIVADGVDRAPNRCRL